MIGLSLAIVGILPRPFPVALLGNRESWLGERRTLYIGQFFGVGGMVIAGLARNRSVVTWPRSRSFRLEYLRPRRAGNDDSSRQRTRARGIAGRYRVVWCSIVFVMSAHLLISGDIRLVH